MGVSGTAEISSINVETERRLRFQQSSFLTMKQIEWVNCLPSVVLKNLIGCFPYYRPMVWGCIPDGVGPLMAYILYMAGANEFNFTLGRIGGCYSRPENLQIHTSSIEVTPYILGPDGSSLLECLLKKVRWATWGGAAETGPESYMQCCLNQNISTKVENINQVMSAFITFKYLKQEFPR